MRIRCIYYFNLDIFDQFILAKSTKMDKHMRNH